MLAVQVELLTGRYVATRFNDRTTVEWPPHPARLFSAAVAVWAEANDPDPGERAALTWWEALGAPAISCSWGETGWSERAAVTHFVPDNDVRVAGRDIRATYHKLRAAHGAVEEALATGDAKLVARAERRLATQRVKASADSLRVASNGSAPEDATEILPDRRGRQARVYPTAIPVDDRVTYAWADADGSSPHVDVLDQVLGRIARLGHSSSLVAVGVVDDAPAPVLVPDDRGWVGIRVAAAGQVDALEAAFVDHQGTEPRTLPAEIAGYRDATAVRPRVPGTVFSHDDWLLLAFGTPRRFTVRDTLALSRGIKGALMRWAPQPPPEIISGHRAGSPGQTTAPTERPHLAVVPLPFVGHEHADGLVQAVALVLPSGVAADERAAVLVALGRWLEEGGGRLRLGDRGATTVSPLDRSDASVSARPSRWTRAGRRWTTVTPIALDRNPGPLAHKDLCKRRAAETAAREIMRRACADIGLPPPADVSLRADAPVRGTRPARAFPRYAVQAGRLQRVLVHADLAFDEDVRGPLLLGAGRYLGYGLCVPLPDRQVDGADSSSGERDRGAGETSDEVIGDA